MPDDLFGCSTAPAVQGSAEFSPCGEHRLRLDRWWADGPRALIGLANPSKAGADENPRALDHVDRRNLDLIRELSAKAAIRIIACGNLVPADRLPPFLAALSLDGQHPVYCFGLTKDGAPKHPLARGKSWIKETDPLVLYRPGQMATREKP